MKLLIDECLSPDLAEIARDGGFPESTHVNWLGLSAAKDWTITRRAVDEGFVLVTNNTDDFIALYRREALHGGLVCLSAAPGLMNGDLQKRLFGLALEELRGGEPYNQVLQITAVIGGAVTLQRAKLP